MTMEEEMDRICKICGFTYGSHRGDNICRNQCPRHEGRMDWDMDHITTFVDSGKILLPEGVEDETTT